MNLNTKNIIVGSRNSQLAKQHIKIFERSFKRNIDSSLEIRIKKKFFRTTGDKFLSTKIYILNNKKLVYNYQLHIVIKHNLINYI